MLMTFAKKYLTEDTKWIAALIPKNGHTEQAIS